MNSKSLGCPELKAIGLDGTWIPRGHFGEHSFECPKCGKICVHHESVRASHLILLQKGDGNKVQIHPKLAGSHRILITAKGKKYAVRHDCIVYDYDNIVKYKVIDEDGTVEVRCPKDKTLLMTYTPSQNHKKIDGEMHTHMDGQRTHDHKPVPIKSITKTDITFAPVSS